MISYLNRTSLYFVHRFALLITIITSTSFAAIADDVVIKDSTAARNQDGSYTISTTLIHPDEGWDHFADKWDVIDDHGTILGERVLFHPHGMNVAFTRHKSGIEIPENLTSVNIRAYCSVDGVSANEFTLIISR